MSEHLAVHAEVEKLARLLDVPVDELEFVRALPSATIHELAGRISDTLYDAGKDKLHRVAAASKLVPAPVSAAVGQKYFGPLLSARTAVLLDQRKAVDMAKRLPPKFLAEVSLHLDPRRAADIIAGVPDDLVVKVARELIARREFVTMGRFVGYVSRAAILRAMEHAKPEELLRVAFFVEAQNRFDEIVDALSDEQIGELIRAAADQDLWVEALSLVDAVSAENKVRVANIAGRQSTETLTSMARTAHEGDLYDAVLPLVTLMNAENRQRLAALEYLHQPEVLSAILTTASDKDLWGDLLTIAENLDDEIRGRLLGLLGSFDDEVITGFVEAASGSTQLVERAVRLLDTAQPEHVDQVLKRISALAPATRSGLAARARELNVLDRLGPIATALQS